LVVLQHHERWDGRRYPLGLGGEEICIAARIVSIIDTYDAITVIAPYCLAKDYQTARLELQRHAGTQFDPHLVEVWCQVPQERWQQIRADSQAGDLDLEEPDKRPAQLATKPRRQAQIGPIGVPLVSKLLAFEPPIAVSIA